MVASLFLSLPAVPTATRWRGRLTGWPALRGPLGRALLVLAYAACFVGLHHLAADWATGLYSLWFPGAGLRFAFLWRFGPRIAPAAALAELVMELGSGEMQIGAMPLAGIAGIVGPCLVYGLVIHLVKARAGRRTPMLRLAPLPFTLAAVMAPIAACLSALPWAIPAASQAGSIDAHRLVSALIVFTLGDMLGVLIVAPPLLWLADRVTGARPWRVPMPRIGVLAEAALVTLIGWVVVWAMDWSGLGLDLAPMLLVACWIGLRTGRPGAWASILMAAAVVLPLTAHVGTDVRRLDLHMALACISAVGYLAGSFAEAEARSQAEIARRDRMLYQAERLKTLRAMSVAVIHEISQPLSTIAIEANHLAVASAAARPDLMELGDTASLIARKAQDLAQMVRRLRRFGDRAADAPSPIPLSLLLADLAVIACAEAKTARVTLDFVAGADGIVHGQDIELRQALLNLVRNAIAASPPGGAVQIVPFTLDDRACVAVENDHIAGSAQRSGMGVGLIIARSIAEAHGGAITEDRPAPHRVRFTLDLPLAGAFHE